jgi:polyisoprenoid-binding protein YceI
MKGWVDFDKKTFRVVVNTDDFTTGQRMRDEHMHENYIESEDYPEAVYEGVLESINPQTGATVTKGAMTIHGVTRKDVVSKGVLKISGDKISGNFNFSMLLSDYNIEIPSLVVMKLSNSIENNVTFTLKK